MITAKVGGVSIIYSWNLILFGLKEILLATFSRLTPGLPQLLTHLSPTKTAALRAPIEIPVKILKLDIELASKMLP
jgi:hypothetical protein